MGTTAIPSRRTTIRTTTECRISSPTERLSTVTVRRRTKTSREALLGMAANRRSQRCRQLCHCSQLRKQLCRQPLALARSQPAVPTYLFCATRTRCACLFWVPPFYVQVAVQRAAQPAVLPPFPADWDRRHC